MTLLNTVFFYWLQVSLPRLMPQAKKEGKALQLRVTSYFAFTGASFFLIGSAVLWVYFAHHHALYPLAWLAVPLALSRSALNLNQAFHRSALNFKRYNILECGQAILGLALGLALVYFIHLGIRGAVLGLTAATLCMTLLDGREWLKISLRYFDRDLLIAIMRFGLPLTISYGLAFIIAASDRFLIEYFRGSAEVGIYAAGYMLTDRIITILFVAVSLPSFPLLTNVMENEGHIPARLQTYNNGIMVLMLALPTLAGLLLAKEQLASVAIGSQFRDGAIQLIPWIAIASFFNGLSTHYFDHVFYLAKKPYLLFFTQGPAAILNLAFNLFLIPRYGYMGAAYSCVFSYALLLCLSIYVGRKAFHVHFPFTQALKIMAAVLLMACVIRYITFPASFTGLVLISATGIATYAAGLLLFNVMGVRSRLLKNSR